MWAEPVGSDSVRAYVEMRERGYAALEPVPLKLVAVNKTGRTLCLTFPTAQRFDFIIGKDEEPVWGLSGAAGIANIEIVTAMYRSAKEGRKIKGRW